MLKHVWKFFKNPVYQSYPKAPFHYKKQIFLGCLGWNLLLGVGIAFFVSLLTWVFDIDPGKHASDDLLEKYSLFFIFFLMAVVAPVIEEFIFRGPLLFFKESRFFSIAFYTSCLLFGSIHLSNFENALEVLWISPLLIAPQTVMGVFLGYIRVRIGLYWAILLHAGHNGILFLFILMTADL
ncbi:lysostaphin resistance A-like protein [Muriicola sp.]|uniref:CPBP family intramembrane glutamic endopeptidase n=1 Tax=Muriicola sp. TaxID=2020856 RepID=UPI003C744E6A